MIQRRTVRWLLVAAAVTGLLGCEAGDQNASVRGAVALADVPVAVARFEAPAEPQPAPDAGPRDPVPTTKAPGDVETVVASAAPAVAEPAPATAPAPAPGADPTASAVDNDMQVAPTTTIARPATTVVPPTNPPAPKTAAPLAPASAASPLNVAAAADFAVRTNSVRAAAGVAPLVRNAQLDAYATQWALELAASGVLRHSSSPNRAIATGWSIAGENVGTGGSVSAVHDALVKSSGHYANLVGASYTSLGVGVAMGADGRLWVCEVFGG